MRIRHGASSNSATADLAVYAAGVRAMKARSADDPLDPFGWIYQSRMHGNPQAAPRAPGEPVDWSQCQHGCWFFLPWHRMYVLQLEAIIAWLTGEPDFALPYWDYPNAAAAEIPPAFLDTASPLFEESRNFRPPGQVAPDRWATAGTFVAMGGGRRTTPVHRGEEPGFLELSPHNSVHGIVGGSMASFQSPLDPLFWIHHCNVDRLWQVWLEQEGRENPNEPSWTDTAFDFPDPLSGRRVWRCGEVATTELAQYVYDSTALPQARGPQLRRAGIMADEGSGMPPRRDDSLNLLGASTSGRSVRDRVRITAASGDRPRRRAARPGIAAGAPDADKPKALFLRLENVRIAGGDASAMWNVLVQIDGGERHLVGTIAPFGLAGLTTSGGQQTMTFDITHLAPEGVTGPPATVEVSFEPVYDDVQQEPYWDRVALYTAAGPAG